MITLYRSDFKKFSDGTSPFEDFLMQFGVPENEWGMVDYIELNLKNKTMYAHHSGNYSI